MQKYKVILSFSSIVKISTLLGLGYGIISIPLFLIFTKIKYQELENFGLSYYSQLIIGGLAQGILIGAIVGILGYPVYKMLSKKSGGNVLKGTFNGINE